MYVNIYCKVYIILSLLIKIYPNIILFCLFIYKEHTPACSCVDCEDSCPVPQPVPLPPGPFSLFGYDGYEVTMIIIFICGSAIFILLEVCFSNRQKIGKKQ